METKIDDKGFIWPAFPAKLKCLFEPKNSRYRVLYGGRGAGKSHSVARALLCMGVVKTIRVLCAREFQTSIKDSVHKLLVDQIYSMGIQAHYEVTNQTIRGINGTEFIFAGIKNNINGLKSIEGIDYCWVEEANNVTANSWDVLIPTIRKENSEIWVTFNPELPTDETYKRFVINPPEGAVVQKVNWSDNNWFPAVLDLERNSLMTRDFQAYQNVWEGFTRSTIDGAIFAKEMGRAEQDGRITNVPYDASKPVLAVFDIGWADSTAIWFVQFVGMETRLIRYLEVNQTTISEILGKMQTFGYVYDTLYLPHDAQNRTLASNGRSIEEIVRAAGFNVRIIDRVAIADSINAARTIFSSCYFDRNLCDAGLNCLRHYRYDVDPDTKAFSQKPLHDQYSHGADAFRYIGLMIQEKKVVKRKPIDYSVSSWMG
ncbi:phage_term_2, phage terminase, large subunit, PBSX family [uncultured Caudovirales phage]|uniref:Phage_term_2, phage terminase, large subunit, PBSX family n=1 Tax=uncultured Caudovirales phage TaxID=2100421 RepID=A0A6J5KPY6_9CAUD|nr:phage_term_2, phage terminase, large subunit, PBSX family [uncultured Caudovirales phage]